ncbi:MAG: serine/threonine-protein kinase [Kofleriaceae bacterium]|nr:serine/threonine-protein kinase [Kofleriaceae bacterium]
MRPLVAGTIVAHRYEILALLGSGGMGHVYRARHLALHTEVALKLLGRPSAEHAGRIEREARAIARLDHPGCVRIRDHGVDERGTPYVAMELLDGPTLAAVGAPLEVARAVAIAKSLLAALAHAHAHGVIHRDVKPANVMFRRGNGWRPVLIDFGLASLRDAPALTGNGLAVGSPSYIAPERLYGNPYDARADIYAVGVILYELLAGTRPFGGDSPEEIMASAMTRPPRPLRALVPGVSPGLEGVIRRALAKDPARRFADAEEMMSALDVATETSEAIAADEEPTSAATFIELLRVRPSWLSRMWSWLRYGAWRWKPQPSQH